MIRETGTAGLPHFFYRSSPPSTEKKRRQQHWFAWLHWWTIWIVLWIKWYIYNIIIYIYHDTSWYIMNCHDISMESINSWAYKATHIFTLQVIRTCLWSRRRLRAWDWVSLRAAKDNGTAGSPTKNWCEPWLCWTPRVQSAHYLCSDFPDQGPLSPLSKVRQFFLGGVFVEILFI